MAMLVSLLYGGGGEVWEPEGNGYTRLTTTVWSLSMCRGCHYREYNTKRASGGQMAILVSLLYGGWSDNYNRLIALWWGSEVWKPECNCYIRLTTSLWIEVCIRNSSCHPNPNPNGVTCCRMYNPREPAKRCNPNLLSVV